ncbi:MAG: PTS sugar transporter subunit IIA [Longibaculum sp.]
MEIINEELILVDENLHEKEDVIQKVAELLFNNGRISDIAKFKNDVFKRETEMSTSMGLGIAIPHAQSDYVKQSSLVFIKLKEPICWNDDNVKIIFGIAVPKKDKNNQHLKILSTLARSLMKESFRNKLYSSHDEKEVLDVLKLVEI